MPKWLDQVSERPIELIGGASASFAHFAAHGYGASCSLVCDYDGGQIKATELDFFDALCRVRLKLEEAGLRPNCFGAAINVWPTGMARTSGTHGLKAYWLELGRPVKMDHLVFIFDSKPGLELASVEDQHAFARRYFKSC